MPRFPAPAQVHNTLMRMLVVATFTMKLANSSQETGSSDSPQFKEFNHHSTLGSVTLPLLIINQPPSHWIHIVHHREELVPEGEYDVFLLVIHS